MYICAYVHKCYTAYLGHSSVASAKAKPTKKYVMYIVCKQVATYIYTYAWCM